VYRKWLTALADRQSTLLDALWQTLKPGGLLVYATCSVLKQENRTQVQEFLARTDDACLCEDMLEILPGEQGMDGFFYACLQKPRLALATLFGLIVLLVVFLLLVVLSASGPGARGGATGNIALSNVAVRSVANDWYLNADADIDFYMPDKIVSTFERRYRLTFYELTRHYRVESMADGRRRNYRSLLSALDGLGTLRNELLGISVSERLNESNRQPLVGTMRLQLDSRALPLPLQPLLASQTSALMMALLFLVLIVSLYVLGTTALRLDRFGRYYHWLLLGNGLALIFIGVVIALNAWRLIKEFRQNVAGSRLTVKLVVLSVLLALVPVTLVYGFSVRFLRANINSYFDLEIEQALDDALELSRESLGLQMRTLQRDTISETVSVIALNTLTVETEATEMTLIGPDNRIIASTGLLNSLSVQPDRPDDDLVARARQGLAYVGVDPIGGDLFIRVVTPVLSEDAREENAVLQALYPIANRSANLAESVQSSYQQYRQLVFLRRPLMLSSMLTRSPNDDAGT